MRSMAGAASRGLFLCAVRIKHSCSSFLCCQPIAGRNRFKTRNFLRLVSRRRRTKDKSDINSDYSACSSVSKQARAPILNPFEQRAKKRRPKAIRRSNFEHTWFLRLLRPRSLAHASEHGCGINKSSAATAGSARADCASERSAAARSPGRPAVAPWWQTASERLPPRRHRRGVAPLWQTHA